MKTKPSNPTAFPRPMFYDPNRQEVIDYGDGGMSLRDYFAGKALIASLSHEKNMVCLGSADQKQIKGIAEDCYAMADAMLEAKEGNSNV